MVNALVLILVALRVYRRRAVLCNAVMILIAAHVSNTAYVVSLITVFAVASTIITGLPGGKV